MGGKAAKEYVRGGFGWSVNLIVKRVRATGGAVSSFLGFLAPARGAEGVGKTIEEDRDERWSLL